MTSMREMLCLGVKPRMMRGVRRSDERQRAPESIGELLVMPLIAKYAARSPRPSRWQVPSRDMRRKM